MRFSDIYKLLRERLFNVLLSNTFSSEAELKSRAMYAQQNDVNVIPCHFADNNILIISDLEKLLDDLRDQSLIGHDNINLNSRGKTELYPYLKSYEKIDLPKKYPSYPKELPQELTFNSTKIRLISDINKRTYDILWGFPILYELYIAFCFKLDKRYNSVVLYYDKDSSLSIDSDSFFHYSDIAKEKSNLRKIYSNLCKFLFSNTGKKQITDFFNNLILMLISSASKFTIVNYNTYERNIFGARRLARISQKEFQCNTSNFMRCSIEHHFIKSWMNGQLQEIYFARILDNCEFFDSVIPCVKSIKIEDRKCANFEDSDILAVKDSKMYIFETKRSNSKSSIEKALAQLEKRKAFFEQHNIECSTYLVSLSEKDNFNHKGEKVINISPKQVERFCTSGILNFL